MIKKVQALLTALAFLTGLSMSDVVLARTGSNIGSKAAGANKQKAKTGTTKFENTPGNKNETSAGSGVSDRNEKKFPEATSSSGGASGSSGSSGK